MKRTCVGYCFYCNVVLSFYEASGFIAKHEIARQVHAYTSKYGKNDTFLNSQSDSALLIQFWLKQNFHFF